MKCGPCSYATEAHVIEWQRFPQNASELDHITAVFVTATSATPQNPKMVPNSKIDTITPQNPRFRRSRDALTGCDSMRDRPPQPLQSTRSSGLAEVHQSANRQKRGLPSTPD